MKALWDHLVLGPFEGFFRDASFSFVSKKESQGSFYPFFKAFLKGFLSFLKAFLKGFLSLLKAFFKWFLSLFKGVF